MLVTESVLARLHIVVTRPTRWSTSTSTRSRPSSRRIARAWVDDLRDALVAARGEEAGLDTFRELDATRSCRRTSTRSPRADAVADIAVLERLDPAGDLAIRLEPPDDDDGAPAIKLYRSGARSCSPT